MPEFQLLLLGPTSLVGPDGPVTGRAAQRRRVALLALLGSAPDATLSRDRLLGLLWPESDEDAARHLLADSVYLLRRTLGRGAIVASGEELRLAPEVVRVDVAGFRRASSVGEWGEALGLYRGHFLDGFFLRNAPEFDQWAENERTRLRHDAARAASALAAALDGQGQAPDAVPWAERALELAPYDEATFRRLLGLLVKVGNRSRAEAAARSFVEGLQRELEVAPSEETRDAIRATRAAPVDEPVVVLAQAAPAGGRGSRSDLVTHNLILQGRYLWHRRTRPAVERSMTYFTRATERNPQAADAWSGLSDAWCVLGGRGHLPAQEAVARAAPYAERALALDPSLSAAHASLGAVAMLRREWARSAASLRHAVAIDPGNAEAHHWLANTLLTGYGQRDPALREQSIAVQLNPLAPVAVGTLGWHRYLRGEFGLSRAEFERAVDLDTDFEEGHAGLARAAAWLGDRAAAEAALGAGLARRSDLRGDLLAEGAAALAVLGERAAARQRAEEAARQGALPLSLALAWASLGDADLAFACLEDESFELYWAPHAAWWDPRLDSLRDDPRFARVRDRVREAWRPEWT